MTEKLLTRGVEEVIVKEHLEAALKSGKKLRVKFGIDPTAPDLHLGHTVPLRKLREFQDAGHQAVLIIGDFTAMIGDPSGRSAERKPLTEQEVKANLKKYLKQAGKIINVKKAEVKYNSKWFLKKGLGLVMEVATSGTLNQMLQREDFKKRVESGNSVTLKEAIYPLLQGYDSVEVKSDLEIGGTDQKFNLLTGRQVQKHFGMPEQDIVMLSLLEGTDGVKKMSKSAGNYIAIDAEPDDMFGKIMSVPDNLIGKYYTLLTDEERKISGPREAKLELARIIVSIYHGAKAGKAAKENFIKVFSQHEKPEERPMVKGAAGLQIVEGILKAGAAASKSEARRLVEQGGVEINEQKVTDPNAKIPAGATVKVGKRHYFDT